MANDLNQCNFIGHLGKDPETRHMPSGDAVTNFSIACNWKTKEKEGAEWVRIVTFGKLAEICSEYLKKGSQVYVSGRMQTRKYEKDGQDHYSTEIVADRMQMLGGKREEHSEGQPRERTATESKRTPQPTGNKSGGAFDQMDDDIPF